MPTGSRKCLQTRSWERQKPDLRASSFFDANTAVLSLPKSAADPKVFIMKVLAMRTSRCRSLVTSARSNRWVAILFC